MTGPSSRLSIAFLTVLALATGGCGDDDDLETSDPDDLTLIQVDPAAFVGAVPCADAPGALRTYVATLVDLTPGGGVAGGGSTISEFVLPSSGPVSCNQSVVFGGTGGFVVGRHAYAAVIQGYDRDDLSASAPGVAELVDTNGQVVLPRWRAECGRSPRRPTLAEYQLNRRVTDCDTLREQGAPGPTQIEFRLTEELCAPDAPGAARDFLVRRDGTELGRAACGQGVLVEDVSPGEFVSVEVLVLDGATPVLGAVCTATAAEGIRVYGTCDPLEASGGITVALADVYAALGVACETPLSELTLAVATGEAAPITVAPNDCRGVVQVSELPPGTYDVTVAARARETPDPQSALCSATVEPGLSARAACIGG